MPPVRVPALQGMEEEHIIRHLELRHSGDLKMEFKSFPGQQGRRMEEPQAWITYHDTLHRLDVEGKYSDHYHRRPGEGG